MHIGEGGRLGEREGEGLKGIEGAWGKRGGKGRGKQLTMFIHMSK